MAFSGAKPLTVTADSLPLGLEYNPKTRNLTGFVAKVGTYTMTFKGSNAFGTTYASTRMVIGDTLARTPIMGWNSWNCWGMDVSAERVKQAAVAIKQSGLADYGFRYVNIDDGWQAGRNAIGEIIPNDKFPNMRYLADTVHSLGLRIGLYSSPGPLTCNKLMGSYQHEAQDAATYSNWQIDFLKYDMCSYSQIMPRNPTRADEMKPYTLMGKLLRNQQRDIVFSLCQYGNAQVEQWGPQVKGSLWRTTGDIIDTWESVQTIIDLQYKTHPYAGPGRWNDPDMLVVGWLGWGSKLHKTRLTPSEQYYHISMWCMLSAPLILGCDLTKLDAFTKNLLTNREVIAIDQDELGRQATRTYADTSRYPWAQEQFIEVWQKPLANGDVAIGIFNRGAKEATYKLDLASLKLPPGKVRDLWRQKDVAADAVVTIPRHGCALFRVGKGM